MSFPKSFRNCGNYKLNINIYYWFENSNKNYYFYYPPVIKIMPVSPEPDSIIISAGITTLMISARIKSFFAICDISLQ